MVFHNLWNNQLGVKLLYNFVSYPVRMEAVIQQISIMVKKQEQLEKEYEVLKNERELIHACIKNINKQVQSLTDETVGYFTSRNERLLSLEIKFNDVQLKIIEYKSRNKRVDQKLKVKEYQMLIDDLIFGIQKNCNRVMNSCTTNNVNDKLKPVVGVNVPLPKINIPPFDGQIDMWFDFKTLFDSLVHNNDSLSNIEKF